MQKTYFELSQGIRLLARVSALVAVVLLWTSPAVGQVTVVVNCPGETIDVLQDAINSLIPLGGGTIQVNGTCVRTEDFATVITEPFLVNGFTGRLTIEGVSGGNSTLMQEPFDSSKYVFCMTGPPCLT